MRSALLFRLLFLAILAVFVVNFLVLFLYFPVHSPSPRWSSQQLSDGRRDASSGDVRGSLSRTKHRKQQQLPPLKEGSHHHHHPRPLDLVQARKPPKAKTAKKHGAAIPEPKQKTKPNPHRSDCPLYGCPIYPPELTDAKVNQTIRDALESSGFALGGSVPISTPASKPTSFEFAGKSFATLSQQGKSHVYNQDRAVFVPDFLSDLLASTTSHWSASSTTTSSTQSFLACIFDGHGQLGHDVAQEIVEKFPLLLADKLTRGLGEKKNKDDDEERIAAYRNAIRNGDRGNRNNSTRKNPINEAILVNAADLDRTDLIIQKALNETFLEVNEQGTEHTFLLGGCTASVTLRWGSKLYVANAGDSQTILVSAAENKAQKQAKQQQPKPIAAKLEYQTRRDKANQPGERARVEQLGGRVHVNAQGFDPRVIVYSKAAKDTIGLAMSRSLGDWEWKEVGVTAEPTIDVIDISKLSLSLSSQSSKVFLLVASDGFWDMRQLQFLAGLASASFVVPSHDETIPDQKPRKLRPLFHMYDIIQRITPKIQQGYRDDITATIVGIVE
mmetsp:Transcript_28508/g.77180  ORF Transcript_28508/g.77180 Transcript_28508/m.77180 type:complete len:557 (+) Transcript_28508:157-1827(+)|eukprot:CAMPEP_0172371776 /NCGR_PEP_ID=MMETSP1060-20121228/44784_1 /TAXON_ID=37318 /ORGANISM="Pseudo-nitzschia pungens, Strain cf. cingulata" /LENGTH=556 /DNA_ID=CAMNT_0013097517 /DNA_START=96 /DNA_END=1766 /DNA_ORIENTATION=-